MSFNFEIIGKTTIEDTISGWKYQATGTDAQPLTLSLSAPNGIIDITPVPFDQQPVKWPGFLSGWTMTETTGTVINEVAGTSAYNGTYAGSIPLASTAFAPTIGTSVPTLADATDETILDSAALRSALDSADFLKKGWLSLWYKLDPAVNTVVLARFAYDTNVDARVARAELNAYNEPTYARFYGSTTQDVLWRNVSADWQHLFVRWDSDADTMQLFVQGVLVHTATYTKNITGALAALNIGKVGGFRGGLGYVYLGAGGWPTAAQVRDYFRTAYPDAKSLFACGDSTATGNDDWIGHVIAGLNASSGDMWIEEPPRIGLSGQKIADLANELESKLPTIEGEPDIVLVSVEVNDLGPIYDGLWSEADNKLAMVRCLNAIFNRWPNTEVRWAHPYKNKFEKVGETYVYEDDGKYDATAETVKGWNGDVLAIYPNAYAGDDKTGYYKTGIETLTLDGVHPNDAGNDAIAAQLLTLLT